MAHERVGREREGMHGCFCWRRWSLLWRRALCNCSCFGFSAGGTLSDLVRDFKAFLYVAVVGLASGVARARGESGSGGDGVAGLGIVWGQGRCN